jgi:uncharacterized RDD family membrane protein YckC
MAVAAATTGEKVGFGRRFVAFIIDAVILGVINNLLMSVTGGNAADPAASSGMSTLVGVLYVIGFWTAWNGQTPGKKVMGLRIVKADGSAFGVVPGIIRYVGYFISGIALLLGFLWILFDKDKQGWHDKIAGTYVVKA